MIVKGGTAYINAGGLNLASESEQSVPGLFSELTVAMQSGKPVVIDITGVTPATAVLHAGDSAIVADITGYSISVNSDDAVTVTQSGSGSSIPTYTQAEWDALSTEQKLAVRDAIVKNGSDGFIRGDYVYGGAYNSIGKYLPYSDSTSVICEAYSENYTAEETWGFGDSPIAFSNEYAAYQQADAAVLIPVKTHDTLATVDLGSSAASYTVYMVGKISNATDDAARILSSLAAASSGSGMFLYGNTYVTVSNWGNNTSTVIPSTDYFVAAIQFDSVHGTGFGIVRNEDDTSVVISKTVTTSGQYIVVGNATNSIQESYHYPSDMLVRYLAVVNEPETPAIVMGNLQNLADNFI